MLHFIQPILRHAAAAVVAVALFAGPSLVAAEPTPGKQVAASTAVKVAADDGAVREATLRYLLYLPPDYAADEAKKWPLVLFLHGSGERGDDLEKVKVHGPPKLLAARPDLPAIVVSPQCPAEARWNAQELAKLVETLANTYRVDRERLYVTGLSMGGAGTWSLLAEYPDLFAAAVPICGRGDVSAAERIAKTPIWAFVGGKDRPQTVTGNEEMVAALKKVGANVQFKLYPDLPHDCWTVTYEDPNVWEWLLAQRREKQSKVE
ncbi:MAG: prolyl oligopeptidase family serine peptidase [Pirellulaceae bacterium]|jgi:predicted peptidase|nr:prolyl oligopeptidase family serine peptidase [Pirellulaceae bacterium]